MISKHLKFSLAALTLFTISLTQAQEKKKPSPEKIFASFDANEDDMISLEEFKGRKRKNDVKPEMLEKRFEAMDVNDDNLITLEEFMAGIQGGKGTKKNKKAE